MTDDAPRRLTRGWAITLLVLVVVVFVGGGWLAALSFVTSVNARPQVVTCTVESTFGDATSDAGESGRPGFSVQTSGSSVCEDFYVADVALRAVFEVGETYDLTIVNRIGYTTVESATLVTE
jgi:hypothetical protein